MARRPVTALVGICGAVVASAYSTAYWGKRRFASIPDSELPLTYEPHRIAGFWGKEPAVVAWRLSEIVNRMVPLFGRLAVEQFVYGSAGPGTQERNLSNAIETRQALTELGPAFIKLGQMLSTRPDIVSQEYLDELRKLCDAVPPFPSEQAIEIIRSELGDTVADALGIKNVTVPVAAASLGQVYKVRARFPGESTYVDVAVKIQRPDMIKTVSLDLFLLRKYGEMLEGVKEMLMRTGILSRRKQFDVKLLDNFAQSSYLELDYMNEGNNQEFFRNKLVPLLNGRVRVPKVYWNATSRKVLTSEWIDGEQLVQSSPNVIDKLVPLGIECFLAQLLDLGMFHSDPHRANILVDKQGKLCLIDFGLCVQIPKPDMQEIANAIINLMKGDVAGLLENAVSLGFLPKGADTPELRDDLVRIFNDSKLQADLGRFKYRAVESRRRKFKEVSLELNSVFYSYPFSVPEYFALITRALIVLEGIAVVGEPTFDIFSSSYPYVAKRVGNRDLLRIGKAALSTGA